MAHEMNRRNLLTAGGAITVSMLLPGVKAQAFVPSEGLLLRPPLDPRRLASYISVNADGTVTAWFGKPDMGQGTDVGVAQMVAEELDIRVERVKVDFSDTISSLNQGGASSSVGVSQGGRALANAAAEARLVLLEMASKHLGAPLSDLTIHDGVISTKGNPTKSVSFGELIGGRWFDNEV